MSDMYITFDLELYDGDIEKMYEDIFKMMKCLIKNEYVTMLKQEDVGIYVLEYGYENREYGCKYPMWLTPDESELIQSMRFKESSKEDDEEE